MSTARVVLNGNFQLQGVFLLERVDDVLNRR